MKNVFIIGQGVTAKAIQNAAYLNGFNIVLDCELADVVVASPGIPPSDFPKTSQPIISEIEFAYQLLSSSKKPPILIGITGTNGKTTVASLIAHILDVPVAGNIGVPLITFAEVADVVSAIVVELSSFQLETCFEFRPNIAIVLNITEDHLKRHKTMREYVLQKKKIFSNQGSQDYLIYNAEDPLVCEMVVAAKSQKIPFFLQDPDNELASHIALVGKHNQLNAVVAIKAARLMGFSDEHICEKLKSFKGVAHRIQYVGTYEGRRFYNDSKATNPDSTMVALNAFSDPLCVILCGEDKGLDLVAFVQAIHKKVKVAIVFGEMGQLLMKVSQMLDPDFLMINVKTLSEAVQKAMLETCSGDVILFSPSSSSFDMFRNFEHRGEVFMQTVKGLYENA